MNEENVKKVFAPLGASSHSVNEREKNDYYATDPVAVEKFLNKLNEDNIFIGKNIWECACGGGHICKVLHDRGYNVVGTDIVDRGYKDYKYTDFLTLDVNKYPKHTIFTNPPYKYALEFAEKALQLVDGKEYVIMFLKIQFLEGKRRYSFFKKHPPKYVYIHSSRVLCVKGGDFEKNKQSSAVCFAWYIWEKGFKGDSILRWIE